MVLSSPCCQVLHKNYEKLLELFEEATEQPDSWDDESLDKVNGLLHFLNSFLFCFLVCVFYKILEKSPILYSVLQNTGTDFSYGISKIECFKNFVSSLCTNEYFGKFYEKAEDKVG